MDADGKQARSSAVDQVDALDDVEPANGPSPVEFADSPLSRVLRQPFLLGLFLLIQDGGWTPSTLPRSTTWTFDYNARLRPGGRAVADLLRHMALPVLSLLLYYTGIYTRFARTAMMEVRGLDFVHTARSKGLRPWRIELRHVVRNGLMPLVTLTGLQLGTLLGGSVVVKTVLSWPGLGRLASAVGARDVAQRQGGRIARRARVAELIATGGAAAGARDPPAAPALRRTAPACGDRACPRAAPGRDRV